MFFIKSIPTVIFIFVFFKTYLLAEFYLRGDQAHYQAAFDFFRESGLSNAWRAYPILLGTKEPVYFAITWPLSQIGIPKNLIMSFFNSVLAVLGYRLFRLWGAHWLVASLIVLTNFYFYVMYLSAERLKFGIIFLIASTLLWAARARCGGALSGLLALLSHVQVAVVYTIFIANAYAQQILRLLLRYKLSWPAVVSLPLLFFLVALFYFYFEDHLLSKLSFYFKFHHPAEAIPTLVTLLICLFYTNRRVELFLVCLAPGFLDPMVC